MSRFRWEEKVSEYLERIRADSRAQCWVLPGKMEDLDSKSVSDTNGFYELGEASQFPLARSLGRMKATLALKSFDSDFSPIMDDSSVHICLVALASWRFTHWLDTFGGSYFSNQRQNWGNLCFGVRGSAKAPKTPKSPGVCIGGTFGERRLVAPNCGLLDVSRFPHCCPRHVKPADTGVCTQDPRQKSGSHKRSDHPAFVNKGTCTLETKRNSLQNSLLPRPRPKGIPMSPDTQLVSTILTWQGEEESATSVVSP